MGLMSRKGKAGGGGFYLGFHGSCVPGVLHYDDGFLEDAVVEAVLS